MIKKIKKKLSGKKGETLMEALAACLIIALAVGMMAQVMVTAANAVQKSRLIQENNDKIMAAFWSSSDSGIPVSSSELRFSRASDSSFGISVQLNAYNVSAESGELSGTVYEFSAMG